MESPGNSPTLEIRHNTQQSHDSGAYLDWCSEDSGSPTHSSDSMFNVSGEFVTVVSVGSGGSAAANREAEPTKQALRGESDVPFVTVLAIGTVKNNDDEAKTVSLNVSGDDSTVVKVVDDVEKTEEVVVYRLPGERLGFGLKFEGGINSAELVKRLFIQSCAEDSPASRARCSWGKLQEGDEILEIDGVHVSTMTRLDCVRCLKESHVVIKLLIRHQLINNMSFHTLDLTDGRKKLDLKATKSMPLSSNDQLFSPLSPAKSTGDLPLVISAEMKKCLPGMPPPIPPRKVPRKPVAPSTKDVPNIVGPPTGFCDAENNLQPSPRPAVRTSLQQDASLTKDMEYRSAPTTPRVRQRLPPVSPRVEPRLSHQSSPEVARHFGKRLPGFNMTAVPPEAEVYLDLLALEEMNRLRHESESDDTGSSLSTVVDRLSTTNSSFSDLRSSASSTCGTTTPSTPTSTSTPALDMAKVLGPFEQLEREFTGDSAIDHEFLLTKLVDSEASFVESRKNSPVSAEEVANLLKATTKRSNDEVDMTLQPPPNFQDSPFNNGEERNVKKVPNNYNNVDIGQGKSDDNDVVQLKKKPKNEDKMDAVDVPDLPPKPAQRKESPPTGRFRSGKKRPPPPPPPRNDRPKCPQPPPGTTLSKSPSDEQMVEIDLTRTQENIPEKVETKPEIIERYPVSGTFLPRLIDSMSKDQMKSCATDDLEDVFDDVADDENDDDGKCEEDNEPISLDYSVLDQHEDICITVPQMILGGKHNISAADFKDIPVIPVEINSKTTVVNVENELGIGEARVRREVQDDDEEEEDDDEDVMESEEFQITAVTSGTDVFFPYHWSVTSHLATIGEDEEEEGSLVDSPQRSSSQLESVSVGPELIDVGATQRDAAVPDDVLGSAAVVRENTKLHNNQPTMDDSNDDELKFELSSGSNKPIDGQRKESEDIQLADQQDLLDEPAGSKTRQLIPSVSQEEDVVVKQESPVPLIRVHVEDAEVGGDGRREAEVAATTTSMTDANDKGARGTMDAMLALDSLTASIPNKTLAYLHAQTSPSDTSLSPPPSFSRLPPDGHEFPTNYQEPNHFNVGVPALIEMDMKVEKMPVEIHVIKTSHDMPPPPLPSSTPPQRKPSYQQELDITSSHVRQFTSSVQTSGNEEVTTRSRPTSWRKDQKSEQSVRDKIAMFASQKDNVAPQPAQNAPIRRLSNTFKSSENVFYEDDTVDCSSGISPSGKLASRSVISVDKIGQSSNYPSYRQNSNSTNLNMSQKKDFGPFGSSNDVTIRDSNEDPSRSLDYTARTLSSMDLLSSSSSAYSSCSPDSSLSSTTSSYAMGYSSTLPRKLNNTNNSKVAPTPFGTTPRKSSAATEVITVTPTSNLHTRSQSLVDVAARPARHSIGHDVSKASAEDMRRASLNALVEQRKRSMSKLRGLVIPEKVSEVVLLNQHVFDLPEIKSRESILATKPPLVTKEDTRFISNRHSLQNNNWGSTNQPYPSLERTVSLSASVSTNLSSPPWKSQAPSSNLPKYSPAFKRKSLAVCGASSTASSVSSSLNSSREELRPLFESNNIKSSPPPLPPTKPPRNPTSISNNLLSRNISPNYNSPFLYNTEPPKSLESITSPTRSDSSFEYIRENSPDIRTNKNDTIKNGTIFNDLHKNVTLTPSNKSMSDRGRSGEDDSDNDSAVSSSRSSISHDYSPPQSPIPDNQSRDGQHHTTRQHLLLSPLPSSGSGTDRRPLRRTLSSETTASAASSTASTLTSGSQASCSSNGGSSSDSGRRILKAQSVEAINRKNVLSSARYSCGRDAKVGSPLIQRKFEDEEERSDADERDEEDDTLQDDSDLDQCNGDGSVETKDVMFYSSYAADDVHGNGVRVAYLDIVTTDIDYDVHGEIHEEVPNCNVAVELREEMLSPALPVAAPRRSNSNASRDRDIVRVDEKVIEESFAQCVTSQPHLKEPKVIKTAVTMVSQHQTVVDGVKAPKSNGHDLNGKNETIIEPVKLLSRRSSYNVPKETNQESLSTEEELMNVLGGKPQRIVRQKSKDDGMKPIEQMTEIMSPPMSSRIPTTSARSVTNRRSVSVNDIRKAFEKAELALNNSGRNGNTKTTNGNGIYNNHARVSSLDSTTSEDSCAITPAQYGSVTNLQREQFGSITSLASSTSLISPQELLVLIDEANQALEEQGGGSPPVHEVLVVVLHRELTGGSVGITLAGGADYEAKEITVHKVLGGSAADRDGRIQKGDRILSINGKSMKGVTHRESLNILKAPRTEVILVISRPRAESVEGLTVNSGSNRPPRILEQPHEGATSSGSDGESTEQTARGPPVTVTLMKAGAGLGFSLEGGKDSPLGDKPLIIKKIFMGGCADKSGLIRAGDELLKVNDLDVITMSRIEAWGIMKKLPEGKVALTVRHKVENKPRVLSK